MKKSRILKVSSMILVASMLLCGCKNKEVATDKTDEQIEQTEAERIVEALDFEPEKYGEEIKYSVDLKEIEPLQRMESNAGIVGASNIETAMQKPFSAIKKEALIQYFGTETYKPFNPHYGFYGDKKKEGIAPSGQPFYGGTISTDDGGMTLPFVFNGPTVYMASTEKSSFYKGMTLYDENTMQRIYLFDSDEERNEARKNWELGQSYLTGKTVPEEDERVVIVDGRLVPGATFIVNKLEKPQSDIDDRKIYYHVPYKRIADALYTNSGAHGDNVLRVTSNGIGVNTSDLYIVHAKNSERNETTLRGYDYAYNENAWTHKVGYAIDDEYYWPVELAMSQFGWKVYVDDRIMLIITDPCNYSSDFRTLIDYSVQLSELDEFVLDDDWDKDIDVYDILKKKEPTPADAMD